MIHLHYDPRRGTAYRDGDAPGIVERAIADQSRTPASPHRIHTATANIIDALSATLQRGALRPIDLRATSISTDGTRTAAITADGLHWPHDPEPTPLARFERGMVALAELEHPKVAELLTGLQLAWRGTQSDEQQRAVAALVEQLLRGLEITP